MVWAVAPSFFSNGSETHGDEPTRSAVASDSWSDYEPRMKATSSILLLLAACAGEPSVAQEAPEPTPTDIAEEGEPSTAEPAEPDTFGAALTDRALTPLAQITAAPADYAGQVVKTEGEIQQVCQRMGCWMEMSSEGGPTIRVPLAGHNYFLPRDASGRHAIIEGEVALVELSQADREHLESEGALAVATSLQISATGVVLR